MNPKVVCLFVLIAAAWADIKVPEPERYPAGVDPALCPGYPVCDNALLHGTERILAIPTVYKTIVPTYQYSYLSDEYPVKYTVAAGTLPPSLPPSSATPYVKLSTKGAVLPPTIRSVGQVGLPAPWASSTSAFVSRVYLQ